LTAASDPRAIGLATSIGKAPEYGVNH